MNIVVCVRRVPDLTEAEVSIDKSGKDIDKRDLIYDINEWDSYAVEAAVLLKEAQDATVTAINANTDPAAGPTTQSIAPEGTISVSFPGYGVAFVRLAQAQPQISPGGIVNEATYAGGGVAPGELADIFGQNLGPASGLSTSRHYS